MISYFLKDFLRFIKDPKHYLKVKNTVNDLEELLTTESFKKKVFDDFTIKVTLENKYLGNTSKEPLLEKNIINSNAPYSYGDGVGYLDGDYYGDEAIINDVPSGLIKSTKYDIDPESYLVYYFAIAYVFGNKKNNYFTVFALDEEDNLYCLSQKRYRIINSTDIINACDILTEEYNLDKIIFINTDPIKQAFPYVERGVNDKNTALEIVNQNVDFVGLIFNYLPLLNSGKILIKFDAWYLEFQKELSILFEHNRPNSNNNYSTDFTKNTINSDLPYSRLKSFIYGVEYWTENKGTGELMVSFVKQ